MVNTYFVFEKDRDALEMDSGVNEIGIVCQNKNMAVLLGYLKNSVSFSSALISCLNKLKILEFFSIYNK